METFDLTIVSDSKILYAGSALYCGVTTLKGSIGFEAFHEPFIGILKDGSSITYLNSSKNENNLAVKDGIVSFENNICTITASL